MNNRNKALAVAKINFKYSKLAYMITMIVLIATSIDILVDYILNLQDNMEISIGNYVYLLIILVAIFIPALNFSKIMHLGGNKIHYLYGCFINYAGYALAASALNIVFYSLIDPIIERKLVTYNLTEIFGWSDHGILIAFLQQAAFLFFAAVFIHTLTTLQTFFIGMAVDVALIAIISTFIPIEPLRKVLIDFFYLIIYNDNSLLQILACLVLSALIYFINFEILKKKRI